MNEQMSLEDYKKKVEESLMKNNNCSTQETKRLMKLYEEDFPELMKTFSDEKVASLAMVMGY